LGEAASGPHERNYTMSDWQEHDRKIGTPDVLDVQLVDADLNGYDDSYIDILLDENDYVIGMRFDALPGAQGAMAAASGSKVVSANGRFKFTRTQTTTVGINYDAQNRATNQTTTKTEYDGNFDLGASIPLVGAVIRFFKKAGPRGSE